MSDTKVTTKTYIACRPGMQAAMQAQFVGMEVIVEPGLVGDFEFRKRVLSGIELIEAELEKEEQVAADPKVATTVLIPLVHLQENEQEFWDRQSTGANEEADFLVVRARQSLHAIMEVAKDLRPTKSTDYAGNPYINAGATAAALKAALEAADIEVYSISLVVGLAAVKL